MPVSPQFISVKGPDGLTVYAIFRRVSDQGYYNTLAATFESFNSAHWYGAVSNNYSVAAAKTVQSSNIAAEYTVTVPSMLAGVYWAEWYIQQGTNPAVTDGQPFAVTQDILWNGTVLLPSVNSGGNEVVDLGATQSFNNSGQISALPATFYAPATGTVPSAGTAPLANQTIPLSVNYPFAQAFQVNNFDASTWTQVVFTVKASPSDADSAAKITIKKSNPSSGSDGLILLNGAAPSGGTSASDGAIAVAVASTTQLALSVSLTARGAAIAAGEYVGEITVYGSGGKLSYLGSFVVSAENTVRSNPTTS